MFFKFFPFFSILYFLSSKPHGLYLDQCRKICGALFKGGIEGEEHLLATLEMEAGKHDEELLAEALLLQEELGDDLADHVSFTRSNQGEK